MGQSQAQPGWEQGLGWVKGRAQASLGAQLSLELGKKKMSIALYMNLWLKSGNDHHSVMQVIKPAAAEL